MLRPLWCSCNKRAHVLSVCPSTSDTSSRGTAECDRLICPSQESSPRQIKDRGGSRSEPNRWSDIIKHNLIWDRLILRGLNVRLTSMTALLLHSRIRNHQQQQPGGGPTPRRATVTWRAPSHAQTHTVGGSRAQSGRPTRLSDCVHTTGSSCLQEACGGCLAGRWD